MFHRLLSIALLLFTTTLSASVEGTWRGTITAGDVTPIVVEISRAGDELRATFVAVVEGKEMRGAYETVRLNGTRLLLATKGNGSVSEGDAEGDVYAGEYRNARGGRGTFRLVREGANRADSSAGRVIETSIPAPSLRGNLLGDPDVQKVAVYLPPSYDREPQRRYPVVVLLHGIAGSYEDWTRHWQLPPTLDRLIARGDICEMIVVMPNGANRYMGGFYLNSPVTGGWEDFITRDLLSWVDREYRTTAPRAIAGHSMGGFGAIMLSMKHPDLFASAYAMSPCCLDSVNDISYGNAAWRRALTFKTHEDLGRSLEEGDFYPVAIVALTAVFSPDKEKGPLFVKYPVTMQRGEIIPTDDYDRWLDQFPIRQIGKHAANLRTLRGLHLDYGIDDQFAHIPEATADFSEALSTHRIPHTLDVYRGDHRAELVNRLEEIVFPTISRDLGQ
ncbi:MAG TPA: alpha/beta fold hydrolase [Thermoanaerobaculia bacterium]